MKYALNALKHYILSIQLGIHAMQVYCTAYLCPCLNYAVQAYVLGIFTTIN